MGGWRWLPGCEECTIWLPVYFYEDFVESVADTKVPLLLQYWLYVTSSLLQPLKCSPSLRRSRPSCRRHGCRCEYATLFPLSKPPSLCKNHPKHHR